MLDSQRRSRRSVRKKGHDYCGPGVYFVTICTQEGRPWLGDVAEGVVKINARGRMVERWWLELVRKFPSVALGTYVIMPDHMHGIVILRDASSGVSLPQVIHWFKTMTTNAYLRDVRQHLWPHPLRRLWHRNYHDRIICHHLALGRVQRYIAAHPITKVDLSVAQ